MSASKTSTKPGSLSQAFKAAAVQNAEGALAYMLMSAFGVSLTTLMDIADKAVASGDVQLIMLALTAGVQIRNHVVFVGAEYGGVRQKYPELIIEGPREQQDQFNFGALHALGHIFAHLGTDPLGRKILLKAGSCITGEYATDSPAGIINKEIFQGWSTDDRVTWSNWVPSASQGGVAVINPVMASVSVKAAAFSKTVNPVVPARPAPVSASVTKG